MKTIKILILMACLFVPAAICLAESMGKIEKKQDEGTVVVIKKKNNSNSSDKDDPCITATISGHTLTMNFAQNIGSVLVEISDGQSFMVVTPDNVQAYITSSGSYTVTFTLPGGDEYYGNFVVF